LIALRRQRHAGNVVASIWQKRRCTIVFVTHSVDEALALVNDAKRYILSLIREESTRLAQAS